MRLDKLHWILGSATLAATCTALGLVFVLLQRTAQVQQYRGVGAFALIQGQEQLLAFAQAAREREALMARYMTPDGASAIQSVLGPAVSPLPPAPGRSRNTSEAISVDPAALEDVAALAARLNNTVQSRPRQEPAR